MIQRSPRPHNNFLILRNSVSEDERLSYRARGVLVSLLAKPDNWRCRASDLAKKSPSGPGRPKEGEEAIYTALRELQEVGYVKVKKERAAGGRVITTTYVYDTPQTPDDLSQPRRVVERPLQPDGGQPDPVDPGSLEEPKEQEPSPTDVPSGGRRDKPKAPSRSYRGPKRGESYSQQAHALADEIWETLGQIGKRPTPGQRSNGYTKVLNAVGASLAAGRTENQIRAAMLDAAPVFTPNSVDLAFKRTLSKPEAKAYEDLQAAQAKRRERLAHGD